jgi:hypothetical protein
MPSQIPTTGTHSKLNPQIETFLKDNQQLVLGADEDFHAERRKHFGIFNRFHGISKDK